MKKITLLLFAVALSSVAFGQYYYLPAQPGNPGGLNTDGEGTFTNLQPLGWASVQATSSTDVWSSSQTIPFGFMFNGSARTSYIVSTTGVLTFTTTATAVPSSSNGSLPSASIPDNSIAAWGLEVSGSNDHIASKTFGTAPNRQHWVSFLSASNPGESQSNYTYWSIVLEETSGRVYIVDQQHRRAPDLTIGLQLNGTTAISHPGSPNVGNLAGNSSSVSDNVFYSFLPGSQPGFDLAGVRLIMNDTIAPPNSAFDIYGAFINLGFASVSNVELNYSINGGAPVTSNVSGLSIASFATSNILHPTKWTPTSTGVYSIQMWVSKINGSVDADLSNDYINFDVTVLNSIGIQENEVDGLKIYPNPAKDFITVEIDDYNSQVQVEVLNLLGQVVLTQSIDSELSNRINTSNLDAAVYLVKVSSNGKTSTRKVTIQ
jgi:hypothetical protein